MNVAGAKWLKDPAVQAVFRAFAEKGHQLFAVGGCVRNALLGFPASDVDFATDAKPEHVDALGRECGFGVVPVGVEHGTVLLIVNGRQFEITTFRKDVETDGRHAVVVLGGDMAADAARRDFTFNAFYADANGTVYDPLGGALDLNQRRVRFIGDPRARIREDYLRILRFFRFHAAIGDPAHGIDPDALAACAGEADGIARLSRERIGGEMRKLLAAPDPAPSIASMEASGVLMRVLPGADGRTLAGLVHLEQAAGVSTDWIRRLAAMGGENHKDALRLKRSENRKLDLLLSKTGTDEGLPHLAYRQGAACAVDIILLRGALMGQPVTPDLIAVADRAADHVFPIQSSDLQPEYSGAELGLRLRELEERWIASNFTLTRSGLLS